MRKLFLAAFAVAFVSAVPLAAHAEPAQDLMQVWQQAKQSDPLLAAAGANRLAQHEGVDQARATWLPQASASLGLSRTRVADAGIVDNRERAVGLTISQALVDRAASETLQRAKADAQGQDASYRAAEQDLASRVAQAYFDVLNARETLANTQANEDAFRQQVQQAADRQKAGLSAAVDVEQARAYHESARAQTIVARSALSAAIDALSEITGAPATALKGLRDDLVLSKPEPAEVSPWIATALQNNPVLLATQWAMTSAERRVEVARAAHWPTLTAGVDLGRAAAWPAPGVNDGRNVATVGLTLKLPLFAGGAQQSQVRQALYQRDAAADTLEAERRHVVRNVQQRHRDLLAAIDQTAAARAAVDAATQALASTRVGQGLGTQTMTDLLLAIQTWAGARNAYARARHQAVLGLIQLKQAAGTLTEADLAATNDLLQ